MRIISKFKDYYDSISLIGGLDSTIVYERKEIEVDPDDHRYLFYHDFTHYDWCNVFFCGKFFCGVKTKGSEDEKYVWDIDKIVDDRDSWRYRNYKLIGVSNYGLNHTIKQDYTQINLEAQTPIILITNVGQNQSGHKFRTIFNPRLNEYNFASALDPYTAYQMLEQFVDTHFVHKRIVENISDDVKIAKHGFDKFSFRKEKPNLK